MRWVRFGILVLVFLVLQIGVGSALKFSHLKIVPDLLLLLAILLIFRAPADQALLACWLLGLLKDITSQAPLGSYSLTFGLLGIMLIRLRELLVGSRLLPQIFLMFVSSMLIEHAVWLICVVKSDVALDSYRQDVITIFISALLTAALYPYGYWLMAKLHRLLGLSRRLK
jgi:rod shape-determining protein MreD